MNGSTDGDNHGGDLGRTKGWHNGGKHLFFGTIGLITGGLSLYGMGVGVVQFTAADVAWETSGVLLSADDMSAALFENKKVYCRISPCIQDTLTRSR